MDGQILQRAFAAYLKTDGAHADQPNAFHSGVCTLDGLRYAVLRSGPRTLAVCRVKNNGALRRMKRWPLDISPGSRVRVAVPSEELELIR